MVAVADRPRRGTKDIAPRRYPAQARIHGNSVRKGCITVEYGRAFSVSRNGGELWELISIIPGSIRNPLAIATRDFGTYRHFVLGTNGLYLSKGPRSPWVRRWRPQQGVAPTSLGASECLCRTVFVGTTEGLWRTQDLGHTWVYVDAGLGPLRIDAVDLAPGSDRNVAVATPFGPYYSVTGGDVFIGGPIGDATDRGVGCYEVLALPGEPAAFFAATDLGLFRARKGEVRWSSIDFPTSTPVRKLMRRLDAGTWLPLALCDDGLWESRDRGTSWHRLFGECVSAAAVAGSHVVVRDSSGVFRRGSVGLAESAPSLQTIPVVELRR